MKIYTKTGDKGMTSLIGGTRVEKHAYRIGAYGTVDELNSWVGLLRSLPEAVPHTEVLAEIQDRLFTIGSSLASDPEKSKMKIPDLREEDLSLLEGEMDRMTSALPELKSFVLPGGSQTSAFAHIARCVCRRAEREVTKLSASEPVDGLSVKYLNRLSDYLFVLSRFLLQAGGKTEIPWKPRM